MVPKTLTVQQRMGSHHERSGELLFHSGFLGSPLQRELSEMSSLFCGIVGEGSATSLLQRNDEATQGQLGAALEAIERLREGTDAKYNNMVKSFQDRVEKLRRNAELVQVLWEAKSKDEARELDRELLSLCSCYGAVVKEEFVEYSRIGRTRVKDIESRIQNARSRFKLCRFGEVISAETEGAIRLKHLLPGDSQFARCKRAAVENSRVDKSSNLTAEVVDVFKIENKPLLDSFEQECSKSENGRVKGLFCPIPEEQIEKAAVCGMGSKKALPASIHSAFVLCPSSKSETGKSLLRGTVDTLSLTTPFSRFSMAVNDDGKLGRIKALALCRVLVSRLYTAKDSTVPNSEGSADEFTEGLAADYDVVFRPATEEYLVLQPKFVLPEFIIRYQVSRSDNGTHKVESSSKRDVDVSPANFKDCMRAVRRKKRKKCILLPVYGFTATCGKRVSTERTESASSGMGTPPFRDELDPGASNKSLRLTVLVNMCNN